LEQPGLIQSITFRLHDALPQTKLKEWERELSLSHHLSEERDKLLRMTIEKYLDAGHGACWLKRPEIGELVEKELLHFDGVRYLLLAWCLMPNHVHVLVETKVGWDLGRLVKSWKGRVSHLANRILNRSGVFWQREYFDRFIRDDGHFSNALRYIEENPVKAGLVHHPRDWPMSSARWRE
jgi:REP element-mobilizing transposase RayT